ncbi:MAG: hypothetical protein QNJ70_29125 [Xenococcaceae cyanobacterium MO_207.B15]|nr:hypothetical protein [Xenococcaceae cyanobacterium MO_207.B15]
MNLINQRLPYPPNQRDGKKQLRIYGAAKIIYLISSGGEPLKKLITAVNYS